MFVADEETGGDVGARWLTAAAPDKVRCDMLLNEGAGDVFEFGGPAATACAAREKGIFRFKLTARGIAGHASLPRTGDNALLKLAPALQRLADAPAVVRHDRGAGRAARAGSARTRTTRRRRSRGSAPSTRGC